MVEVTTPEDISLLKDDSSTGFLHLQVVHDKGLGISSFSPEDFYLPFAICWDIPWDAVGERFDFEGKYGDF